jgi:hypothetical protein
MFFVQHGGNVTMWMMVLDPSRYARAFSRTFLHATLLA